jgi:hypothetical protein
MASFPNSLLGLTKPNASVVPSFPIMWIPSIVWFSFNPSPNLLEKLILTENSSFLKFEIIMRHINMNNSLVLQECGLPRFSTVKNFFFYHCHFSLTHWTIIGLHAAVKTLVLFHHFSDNSTTTHGVEGQVNDL